MNAANERQLTILVADDEIGVRQTVSDILCEEGYQVLVAADGREAEQHVVNNVVDLAILDIWMPPGMDGVSLLKRWKDGGLLEFPVVMISAHATLDAAVEAMRMGAKDVLDKPFSSQRLLTTVRKVLATRSEAPSETPLKNAAFGSCATMTKFKDRLMGVQSNNRPVTFVGRPADCCAFYARFLQRTARSWTEPESLAFLAHDPLEILPEAVHGSLYLRGIDRLGATGRRGLYQLIANSLSKKVQVLCELPCPPAELDHADGFDNALLTLLEENVIRVPVLQDCLADLPDLAPLAVRQLLLREKLPSSKLTAEAISALAAQKSEWREGGMLRLLYVLRAAMRTANGGEINANHIFWAAADKDNSQVIGLDLYNRPLREARELFEKSYYTLLMKSAKGNFQIAAKFAGLERTYLYRKVKKYLNYSGKELPAPESGSRVETKKKGS